MEIANEKRIAGLVQFLRKGRTMTGRFRLPMLEEQAYEYLLAAYIMEVQLRYRKFIYNGFVEEQLKQVANCLTANTAKFGIVLCGGCGNGKTTMLKALQNLVRRVGILKPNLSPNAGHSSDNYYSFTIVNAMQIVQIRKTDYNKFCKLAKAALDKVEKYAVLATIDKQELTFPLLNIKTSVQEAMDAVKKELAIPIPALIGQKTWREERTTNINDAIKALVTAINVERDKQNNGIRASVNKTYTYYMQQLNKLIVENKALRNENDTLKAENTEVKQRISQLDENAVRQVTTQKDAVIESLNTQLVSKNEDITKLKTDYNTLWEKYKILVLQWNDLTKQPEIIEAVKRVEVRKEQDAEAKRKEQARQDRYQSVLDRFISEGNEQLKAFSQSSRIDFDEKEAKAIYYGIMATATKSNIALRSPQGAKFAVERFLASMDWNGCGNYRRECIAHWTKLFATDEVVYTEPIIQNFLSFIDYMSCSADTYVSLGGSNGCADQLTNWDGTQKLGLEAPPKKKLQGLYRK